MSETTPGVRTAPPPTTTRTGLVLLLVCTAAALIPAGITGPSVALPDIGRDLGASLVELQWVVNAYNLTFASAMLAGGTIADLLGRRRVFVGGLVVQGGATLASGLVGSAVLLDLLRGVAGVGAAAVMTAGSALLADTFREPAARARAFSLLGASFGVGLALGPSSAGVLVDAFGWRAVFLGHAVVAAAVLLGVRALPESRDPDASRVDVPGTLTFTGSLFALMFAVVEGPQQGWTSPAVLGGFVLAVALMAAFVTVERRAARPMLDLSLLVNGRFMAVCAVPVVLAFGFVCLLVFLPSYFIGVMGQTPAAAGLTMLLMTVPVIALPLLAGRLAARFPIGVLLGLSTALIAAGAAWLTVIGPDISVLGLAGPLLTIGSGVGIAFGIIDGAAVSTVAPARSGMAAGLFNTVRLGSEAVAVACLGSLLVSLTRAELAAAVPAAAPPLLDTAANQVTQGDLAAGGATLGSVPFDVLAQAHTSSLQTVLWVLAGLSAVLVPVIVGLLRPRVVSSGVRQVHVDE